MSDSLSTAAHEVLRLLATSKNVLLSGPPGVGKTRLLSEIAAVFEAGGLGSQGTPTLSHGDDVAIQDAEEAKVFRTVFHQNSKYRDFVTGLAPAVGEGKAGQFTIVEGTLSEQRSMRGKTVAPLFWSLMKSTEDRPCRFLVDPWWLSRRISALALMAVPTGSRSSLK